MENEKSQFYFMVAVVAIFGAASFMALETLDAVTDLALIEGSFQGVVRNGEARLPAEILNFTQESDVDLNSELNEIDLEINNL